MNTYKSTRELKVYQAPGVYSKLDTPQIRLQGEWLKQIGFRVGEPIRVEVRGGELRITLANEILVDDK